MTEEASVFNQKSKLFHRTLKGTISAIALIFIASGLISGGWLAYAAAIIGTGILVLLYANRLEKPLLAISKRRSEAGMIVLALALPICMIIASMIVPYFLWLGWRAGIPINGYQKLGAGVYLLAAIYSGSLLINSAISIFKRQ